MKNYNRLTRVLTSATAAGTIGAAALTGGCTSRINEFPAGLNPTIFVVRPGENVNEIQLYGCAEWDRKGRDGLSTFGHRLDENGNRVGLMVGGGLSYGETGGTGALPYTQDSPASLQKGAGRLVLLSGEQQVDGLKVGCGGTIKAFGEGSPVLSTPTGEQVQWPSLDTDSVVRENLVSASKSYTLLTSPPAAVQPCNTPGC